MLAWLRVPAVVSRGHPAVLLAGLLQVAASTALAQTAAPIPPEPRSWTVTPEFDDRKEAENISGLACAASSGAARACLLVSDEKRYARLLTIEEGTIRLGAEVPLLPRREGDLKFTDTDAESVDFEGGLYYVAGSHGASRRGAYEPSRFFLYRFPVDATGRPLFPLDGEMPAGQVERTDRLEALLAGLPALKDHACTRAAPCRPLQEDGVNIEGLAVRGGDLYLGLRGPSLGGAAFIVRVGVDALFGAAEARPQIFRPPLGDGVGLRDLVKVRDGFLILTGPARPEAEDAVGTAAIAFWAGDTDEVVPLGTLGGAAAGVKPEALLVLGEDERGYRLLVLSDGPAGGRPTEFRVPRRP